MNICAKCGLPEQACICEEIVKSEQRVTVTAEKRRFGKIITTVRGLGKEVNLKELAKNLKTELACGGTVKNGLIELQGDHRRKIEETLLKMGFKEGQINQ